MFPILRNGGHAIHRLRDEMDHLFSNVLNDAWAFDPLRLIDARTYPAVNVWEDADNLYAEAEAPGLRLEDLEVLVEGDTLTLKGEWKETLPEGTPVHRREREIGRFTRVIRLPAPIAAEQVHASLQDGVLKITLPKAEEAKPRKIEVRAQRG